MRKPFVAGNWKMNTTSSEANVLVTKLHALIKNIRNVDVAVCPPFPYLYQVVEKLKTSQIKVGAQNMYFEEKGAYTGEVSAQMIRDVGCTYVILGHSERRQIFGETNEMIFQKIKRALDSMLLPIVCIGETLEQREAGETEKIVETQIEGCLGRLAESEIKKVTVAYEPVWAIGTGRTATPEQAQEVHQLIREWHYSHFGEEVAEGLRVQYGGSVKPENASDLMAQKDIDGALVGGASLDPESFTAIIESAGE